jgi:signal transduction histidine kinase
VEIAVRDTGIGIPPHLHTKVFERFYQVDGSLTRKFGGVGIGLAVVKQIVEAHGSHVVLESESGKGSTFRFVLPAAD